MGKRVGVYGGTFDPIHVAHLVVAAEVRHALSLDRVLLVPAGDPWQKRGRVVELGGGTVGVGTVLYAFAIGPIVQAFLPAFTVRDTTTQETLPVNP